MDARFPDLLHRMATAVEANDVEALVACFVADAHYDDYFYGRAEGHAGLREMLGHFHQGGRDFRWKFFDPVCDGHLGYASYRFSYASLHPPAQGRRVGFEGISCVRLREGKIAHYREVFDRGVALAQQSFAAERIARAAVRHAELLHTAPGWTEHFT